ncbi:hypothetical protein Zmor_004609 [Zophobas morio]|uniref:Uncharacterized protein n=1 Tax=Zophobas morio TaxID=2755281 RepID=A0AA38IRV5_9CUCU|nr:hypothetical protein Zmor_004609 [Zophobas morio]
MSMECLQILDHSRTGRSEIENKQPRTKIKGIDAPQKKRSRPYDWLPTSNRIKQPSSRLGNCGGLVKCTAEKSARIMFQLEIARMALKARSRSNLILKFFSARLRTSIG